MGCDIHPSVERRVNGKWERVDVPGHRDNYPGSDAPKEAREVYWNSLWNCLSGRNYDVFAILANVRNGYGCAGVPTGSGFVPIAQPRGLPQDHCPPPPSRWKDEDEEGWFGDHSFSWVSLAELNAYPWDQGSTHTGVMDHITYEEWLANGKGIPQRYSGGISGPNIKTVSEDEYKLMMNWEKKPFLVEGAKAWSRSRLYVQATWLETNAESVGGFYDKVLPWLNTLGAPENVRLVFGFDS